MNEQNKTNLLDHGYVKLLNLSGPIRRICDKGDSLLEDNSIVPTCKHRPFDADDTDPALTARISFNNFDKERSREQDLRLVEYLMKNKHNSPLEMIEAWFELKVPIFLARQIHRHRTFCLSGDTNLIFNRPCDGTAYRYKLQNFVTAWGNPSQRPKLAQMQLRMVTKENNISTTNVIDAWYSGKKECFKIVLEDGRSIVASENHKFKVGNEYIKLADLTMQDQLVVVKPKGIPVENKIPEYTQEELTKEIWNSVIENYEISNLGRVRSWYSQGSTQKKETPTLKKISLNKNNRAVVNIGGKVYQVSKLVAEAFLAPSEQPYVCHRNDNTLDNRHTNLYYGNAIDNSLDSAKNGSKRKLTTATVSILSIESIGIKDTYDISVAAPEHNFVANDIVVHNCYNEVSARYSVLPEEWYIPEVVGGKPTNGMKQGQEDNLPVEKQINFQNYLADTCRSSYFLYEAALDDGIAPEHARLFLHVNHYTHFIMKGNLHNWMNFLSLRLDRHAQIEARHYANAIYDLLKQYLPETMKLFDKHRRLVPQSGKPREVLVKEIANTKFSELSEDELNSIYAILGK